MKLSLLLVFDLFSQATVLYAHVFDFDAFKHDLIVSIFPDAASISKELSFMPAVVTMKHDAHALDRTPSPQKAGYETSGDVIKNIPFVTSHKGDT